MGLRICVVVAVALCALSACREELSPEDALEAKRADWQTRIAALPDADLRPRMQTLADQVLQARQAGFQGAGQSWPVTYTPDPFLWMTDYATVDDMATHYHTGLIAFTDGSAFRGDVNVSQPFEYPFDLSFAWDAVSLADGMVVPVSGAFRPVPPDVQVNGFGRSLTVVPTAEGFGPDTPLPARAVGSVTLAVPDAMHRLRLTEADVGAVQTFDGYAVTLAKISGPTVRLDVSRIDGQQISFERTPLIVAATDATGRFLEDTSQTTGPHEGFGVALVDLFDTLLDDVAAGTVTADDLDAVVQSRAGEVQVAFSARYSKTVTFKGDVDAVELLLAPQVEVRPMPLDLAVLEEGARDADDVLRVMDIPTSATAYAHELAFLTAEDRRIDLAPDAVAAAIAMRPSIFWTGQAQVHFDYPRTVVSSLFIDQFDRYDFDAAEVSFLDEDGDPVALQPSYEFQVSRLEYGEQNEVLDAVRVTGSFAVNIMPGIQIDTYAATELPDGIAIDGNEVVTAPPYDNVYAIDAAGRFLRRIHRIHLHHRSGEFEAVDYYYGEPAAVVVATPGPTEQVIYRFDSPLAPVAE